GGGRGSGGRWGLLGPRRFAGGVRLPRLGGAPIANREAEGGRDGDLVGRVAGGGRGVEGGGRGPLAGGPGAGRDGRRAGGQGGRPPPADRPRAGRRPARASHHLQGRAAGNGPQARPEQQPVERRPQAQRRGGPAA